MGSATLLPDQAFPSRGRSEGPPGPVARGTPRPSRGNPSLGWGRGGPGPASAARPPCPARPPEVRALLCLQFMFSPVKWGHDSLTPPMEGFTEPRGRRGCLIYVGRSRNSAGQ